MPEEKIINKEKLEDSIEENIKESNVSDSFEILSLKCLNLEEENSVLKDRILRISADMENLRRRTDRDVVDAKTYAITNFARDILSVSDNLIRALDSIPKATKENNSGLKSLIDGVEMTERSMMTILKRYGIKQIETKNQKFDPNFHQSMFEVANSQFPNGTIIQVIQKGYTIGERVLRPSLVGVSKNELKEKEEIDSNTNS